jgi:hypothetical protein
MIGWNVLCQELVVDCWECTIDCKNLYIRRHYEQNCKKKYVVGFGAVMWYAVEFCECNYIQPVIQLATLIFHI